MKKILCFISSIICLLCLFCACENKQNEQVTDPEIEPYLSIYLPVSYFNSETDVTVTVFIGFPETFISSDEELGKAVLVVSQNDEINISTEDIILNTITDFASYIWEKENGKIIYKSTQEYIIPQSVFVENSGRIYCSLYLVSIDVDNNNEEHVGISMTYPILYEKDESGIKLELIKK